MSIEDQAQEHEAKMWTLANTIPPAPVFQPHEAGYGPAECRTCGDDMPALRRRDGRQLCTACQSGLEDFARRRR